MKKNNEWEELVDAFEARERGDGQQLSEQAKWLREGEARDDDD